MDNHSNNRLWALIARKLSGEASPSDLEELERLMLQYPDESFPLDAIENIWQTTSAVNPADTEAGYKDLVRRMKQMGIDDGQFSDDDISESDNPSLPATKKRKHVWFLAGLISLITLGAFLFFNHDSNASSEQSSNNEVSTRNGSKSKLVLPDGSKVFLNAGSTLTYSRNFGNNQRTVTLSGEAFFDIKKNPKIPFIIHTRDMDIRVTGTAFNVKCYPDDINTETSLVRGSIEVFLKGRSEKIMMKPSEKLVVSTSSKLIKEQTEITKKTTNQSEPILTLGHMTILPQDNTVVETSWIDNKLVFRSDRFEDLAIKMERWYGVTIIFADELLKDRRFTGVFEKENLNEALNALQMISDFTYKQVKDQVIISK